MKKVLIVQRQPLYVLTQFLLIHRNFLDLAGTLNMNLLMIHGTSAGTSPGGNSSNAHSVLLGKTKIGRTVKRTY